MFDDRERMYQALKIISIIPVAFEAIKKMINWWRKRKDGKL